MKQFLFILLAAIPVGSFTAIQSRPHELTFRMPTHQTSLVATNSHKRLVALRATTMSPMKSNASQRFSLFLDRISASMRDSVVQWRAFFLTFFGSIIVFRQAIDAKLVHMWSYLITSSAIPAKIFRTDSWEWCLAVACFSVYIHAFGWADRQVRRADEEGRVHPWKKYRLQDRFEADKRRRMLQRSSGANGLDLASSDAPLQVEQSKWNWGAWMGEFMVYCVPLLTWDILAPRRHRRLAAFGAPTTMGTLGGIAGGLLLYDMLFFFGHLAMHKIPLLYRTVHKKHHKIQEVRACEIVRLSVPEEVLEVGFSIVALNLLSVHPFARSIYNIIITFLLTELHCGFDFPWTPQNVVPFGLATGSRRHHYHHRIGKHYYQKFFYHVDRLFGFFQRDDGSLNGDSVKAKAYVPASWKQAPIRD